MDRLDQVLDSATPLLRRAEDVLELTGAPPGHPVWDHLRHVRLMPADAVRAVAGLRPAAMSEAEPELRADARVCVEAAAALPPPGEWEGEAADAYDDQRRRAAAHLAGGDDSLDERFEATADLAAALHQWMTRTRDNLAAALTEVLTSAEAFTLTASASFPPTSAETEAAANLSSHVLRTIADDYAEAEDLLEGSRHLADPIPL
ncbi:hypothetical protein [Paractinoplanes brasiliensis]|uniref:Uncharacterized protein n=1 Tax=Paractinoplanes brasiliensis TaxID=52695 RepID=A0A4R6JUJ7_9ACTN|nr:hypothetical protein [Actinoplanes brasiliensis]TDO39161.1 hypothetical protein C8E87_2836 [Actinoplanes brasiliensis]GID30138.1 hypothetical protein Abr02nite_51210 [Actinoplanes brasiliensis]